MPSQTAAVHAWLEKALGIKCHTEGDVPTDARVPYATHRIPTGTWGATSSMEVDVWCEHGHTAEAAGYAGRLRTALGMGGAIVPCDGGAVVLRRGTPFAQPVADDRAERMYVNVDIEYLTAD